MMSISDSLLSVPKTPVVKVWPVGVCVSVDVGRESTITVEAFAASVVAARAAIVYFNFIVV